MLGPETETLFEPLANLLEEMVKEKEDGMKDERKSDVPSHDLEIR
jgi:hypothetical protein